MINLAYQIIRTARPRQWLKNLSLFAAPVFLGNIFDVKTLVVGTQAFLAFCALTSGIYFVNDIVDAPRDKLHPVKKNRAIASGKLSMRIAWFMAFMLIFGTIFYSALYIGTYFALAVTAYALLQVFYSFFLKNIIILDALTVATGFVLRVYSGALAVEISISSWLILATIGLSLLLAFGKRRSEKTLLDNYKLLNKDSNSSETRKTLKHYPDTLLDSMISTSASFCIITYALFAFQTSPQQVDPKLASILPSILNSPKWMMLTIPMVIYGVARYLYVIYEKKEGESPERVLLSDKPLLTAVVVWGISIILITSLFS